MTYSRRSADFAELVANAVEPSDSIEPTPASSPTASAMDDSAVDLRRLVVPSTTPHFEPSAIVLRSIITAPLRHAPETNVPAEPGSSPFRERRSTNADVAETIAPLCPRQDGTPEPPNTWDTDDNASLPGDSDPLVMDVSVRVDGGSSVEPPATPKVAEPAAGFLHEDDKGCVDPTALRAGPPPRRAIRSATFKGLPLTKLARSINAAVDAR